MCYCFTMMLPKDRTLTLEIWWIHFMWMMWACDYFFSSHLQLFAIKERKKRSSKADWQIAKKKYIYSVEKQSSNNLSKIHSFVTRKYLLCFWNGNSNSRVGSQLLNNNPTWKSSLPRCTIEHIVVSSGVKNVFSCAIIYIIHSNSQ